MSLVDEAWFALAIAIIFGVLGTIAMKQSNGLREFRHTIYLVFFYSISFAAMTVAIKYIELSMVYAVWSGVGTILMAAVGMMYFHEKFSFRKIIYLVFIVIGVIGLQFSHGIS